MNISPENKILTVSQLTSLIRGVIEENFNHVWVEGEVSNLAAPSSGHLYFTLKDASATIHCVMFRSSARQLRFRPTDGMHLILRGHLTVYDFRGDYQIVAEYLEPKGIGSLQIAFQQLKEKLANEGLFSESRKKPLPLLPQKIGVVTSPAGAAIYDILNVINRRFSNINILIFPVKVQGEGAAGEIARAVRELNRYDNVDVIIVTRGGGSLEDLQAFNDEVVARDIANSRIPVISAIGHETDITISDLAADLRAPTPSAAAELVVRSKASLINDCNALELRLIMSIKSLLERAGAKFTTLSLHLKSPEVVITHLSQRIDEMEQRLSKKIIDNIDKCRGRLSHLLSEQMLRPPSTRIIHYRERVESFSARGVASVNMLLQYYRYDLSINAAKLHVLSPFSILSRGYALPLKMPGLERVSGISELSPGDQLLLELVDGSAMCSIENIKRKAPHLA